MFRWLRKRQPLAPAEPPAFILASIPGALDRAGPVPYLDWPAIEAWMRTLPPTPHDPKVYRDEVLRQWMDELADAFGEPYVWAESDELILLTARPGSDARDLLGFADRCYRATKEVVGPPAGAAAKLAVLCFGSQEHMYDYLAPMDADDGEYGGVGGFCVQCDPPHIALPDLPQSIEAVLLHEMTHACLGADVPSWLQEGIAQIVEERLTNRRRLPMEERELRPASSPLVQARARRVLVRGKLQGCRPGAGAQLRVGVRAGQHPARRPQRRAAGVPPGGRAARRGCVGFAGTPGVHAGRAGRPVSRTGRLGASTRRT